MDTPSNLKIEQAMRSCREAFDAFYRMVATGSQVNPWMWTSYQENSIIFARDYIAEFDSEIVELRNSLADNSDYILEVNDIVSIITGVGCRNFCNITSLLMKSDSQGFRRNDDLVNSVRSSIEIGIKMMNECKQLKMTPENRESFMENVRVFDYFRGEFKSLTSKGLFGLF